MVSLISFIRLRGIRFNGVNGRAVAVGGLAGDNRVDLDGDDGMSVPVGALQTVLVVDDDPNVVALSRMYLERDGYRVLSAGDGARGLALAREERPHLVVLDIMLPRMNGLEVCRALRGERDTEDLPVIMLTARVEEDDRLAGLDLGADDYVTKPFSPRELAARVRAVLRRAVRDAGGDGSGRLSAGPVELDLGARRVTVGGAEARLTPTEFRVLALLMRRPGRTFTREEIIDRALGDDFDGFDRTVDAHVSGLRRKLAALPGGSAKLVQTVYGSGYRLNGAYDAGAAADAVASSGERGGRKGAG